MKGSNYCGLNVKWSQLLVPFVKIMEHSEAEAAKDCGAFRCGGRWRLWGVQKQRLLEIMGHSDVEAAEDCGAIRHGDC